MTQLWLKQYPDDTTLTQMTISVIRLWPNSFESESNQIWLTTYESSTTLAVRDLSDIEGSSWVRMRDRDIFPGVWLEDWARSARNEQGKYFSSRTRRLEKLYIFQLDVALQTTRAVHSSDYFFICKHMSAKIEIFLHCTGNGKSTSNRNICVFYYICQDMDRG